jgi:hypothetical protein
LPAAPAAPAAPATARTVIEVSSGRTITEPRRRTRRNANERPINPRIL